MLQEEGLGQKRKAVIVKQTFLQGAVILALASFISRLLGTVYKIPYENMTGPFGFYIYMQVYPLYAMLLTLSTAGFPVAISKLVSEKMVEGDAAGAWRIYVVASTVLFFTGFVFFLLLFLGAPVLATWMGGGEELVLPLRSVSLALLVVPAMAALRGYFQGHQFMTPTGISQVIEQLVRVSAILLLTYLALFLIEDERTAVIYAAAGAVSGAFIGGLSAYGYLLWRLTGFRREVQRERDVQVSPLAPVQTGTLLRELLCYALPIALGSLVLPLFNAVDMFTVKNLLNPLLGPEAAAYWKGIYDRGPTLVQFAAFFATAISLSIVPAVAESQAKGMPQEAQARGSLAVKMTVWIALPAAVGLMILARPIDIMLFRTEEGAFAVAISALTVIFSTMSITCTGILQGVGYLLRPARNLLIAVAVKLFFNLLLTPILQINGAATATVLAYAIAAGLNLRDVRKRVGVTWRWRSMFLWPGLSGFVMGVVVVGFSLGLARLIQGIHPRLEATVVSLGSVLVGAVVYTLMLFLSGAIRRADLLQLPWLYRWVPALERLHLLR